MPMQSNTFIELRNKFSEKKISKEEYISSMHNFHKLLFDYSEILKDVNIRSIDIQKEDVVVTTEEDIKIILNPDDRRTAALDILNFGSYEKDEIDMVRRIIKNNFNILDIGANIGWYTIHLAKMAPEGNVYSFEPIPKTFRSLEKVIILNNLKNVKLMNFGLSEKEDIIEFFFDSKLSVAASMRNLYDKQDIEKIKCKVEKLDIVIERLKIKGNIDFIKCDVEGAELFVIKGAINTLKKNKPIIFIEMLRKWSSKFDYHPNDIISLLKGIGYNCYYIEANKLREIKKITDKTLSTNFFFLNPEKHKDILRVILK